MRLRYSWIIVGITAIVAVVAVALAQTFDPTDIVLNPGLVLGSSAGLAGWSIVMTNVLKKFIPLEGVRTMLAASLVAVVTGLVAGAVQFIIPSPAAGFAMGLGAIPIAIGLTGEARELVKVHAEAQAKATAESLKDKLPTGGLPE